MGSFKENILSAPGWLYLSFAVFWIISWRHRVKIKIALKS